MLRGGGLMDIRKIVGEIDREIVRLEQIRKLLSGGKGLARRGRPPAVGKATSFHSSDSGEMRRNHRKMSAEGRARIVAAQKKRWAKLKRAAKQTVASQEDVGQGGRRSAKGGSAKKNASFRKAANKRPPAAKVEPPATDSTGA